MDTEFRVSVMGYIFADDCTVAAEDRKPKTGVLLFCFMHWLHVVFVAPISFNRTGTDPGAVVQG